MHIRDAGAKLINGKVLNRIEVHGKNLFYFFGEDLDLVVMHIHFGMSGRFRVSPLPGPEPTPTTRLQLSNVDQGIIANLSAMTVQHGDLGVSQLPPILLRFCFICWQNKHLGKGFRVPVNSWLCCEHAYISGTWQDMHMIKAVHYCTRFLRKAVQQARAWSPTRRCRCWSGLGQNACFEETRGTRAHGSIHGGRHRKYLQGRDLVQGNSFKDSERLSTSFPSHVAIPLSICVNHSLTSARCK